MYFDELVLESLDYLPHEELMPDLSPEEVERFVALGKRGRELLHAGELEQAEAAFRAQAGVFGLNSAPYVSLALLEGGRGREDAAVAYLHAAVVRGFFDLREIVNSEAWTSVGRPLAFGKLLDALPELTELDKKWPEWRPASNVLAPKSLQDVVVRHAQLMGKIDAMSPALGSRLTRLWHKTIDQQAASALDTYVRKHPQAEDLEAAVEQLASFLVGGPLQRWDRLPAEPSRRLIRVSDLVLERFPESHVRPTALVALAIGKNAVRDKNNVLHPTAAKTIRTALNEVVTEHSDSPLLATAVVGLVRTYAETGDATRAEKLYTEFRTNHDGAIGDRVQDDLGELALHIGGLPEFHATTLDGKQVDPALLQGKIAVVDFWATWCGPCVEEFSALRRIDKRYGDDVVLLGINLNESDELPVEGLREWIARQEVPGDQVHDGHSWESDLVRTFGVKEIPFNVVVGPDGEVLAVNAHGKRLEKAVKVALQSTPATP